MTEPDKTVPSLPFDPPGPPLAPLEPLGSATFHYVCTTPGCEGDAVVAGVPEQVYRVFWCNRCFMSTIEPDPPTEEAWRVLFWLQERFPLIRRAEKKPPVRCRACGSPPHVEYTADPAGQGWVALCLACGEYDFHGRADYAETILADLVKELHPEFRGRTWWQRVKSWWKHRKGGT